MQLLSLTSPAPQGVSQASATYTGARYTGSLPIFYWVVARYPSGLSQPFGPIAVTGTPGLAGLSAANSVLVSWQGVDGATSYDVLRASSNAYPVPNSTSAVSLANTGRSYTDQGVAGGAYPPVGISLAAPANASIQVDNRSQAVPTLKIDVNGVSSVIPHTTGVTSAGGYAQFNADGNLIDAGGISAGAPSLSGTFAARPASGSTGQLYIPTDSFYDFFRWNGSAWTYHLGGAQLTPPVLADFTSSYNLGASVTSDARGGIMFTCPGQSGFSVRGHLMAYPAAPFTLTIAFIPTLPTFDYSTAGITLSDGTKLLQFNYAFLSNLFQNVVQEFTNVTTLSTNSTSRAAYAMGICWLRIVDDNTNRTWETSGDGVNWTRVSQQARTFHLTPTLIGFGAATTNNNEPSTITLLHWLVT